MIVFSVIGANALYLLYAWLAGAIIASWLSDKKGYGEKAGLATGLLLSLVAVPIWLLIPSKPASDWGRRKATSTPTGNRKSDGPRGPYRIIWEWYVQAADPRDAAARGAAILASSEAPPVFTVIDGDLTSFRYENGTLEPGAVRSSRLPRPGEFRIEWERVELEAESPEAAAVSAWMAQRGEIGKPLKVFNVVGSDEAQQRVILD